MPKLKYSKCDILSDFQTLWGHFWWLSTIFWKNLIFLPDHDDKVEELGYTHTRHEPGCGVVAKHDRDQNEGPNEESHREGNPE